MAARKRQTTPFPNGRPPAGVPLPARTAPAAVRVVGSGHQVPLGAEGFGIGSDGDNALVIDDEYVSGFHCMLERRAGRVVLRDRRSRNGTYVNGARVVECDVAVGTQVVVGKTTLVLVGGGVRARAPAVEQLLGDSPPLRQAIALARRAATTEATILVTGESGTGKELLARLVHETSPRAAGPYVAVNCGALPRELVESELFGHERGAFTGAHERRLGVFEQANGGTLLLDEIGELPREQQTRLLRVLETRCVRRVGGAGERDVDVRIVAATHRDLAAAAERGEFRLDLYHRLCGMEVHLPALRERPEDLAALVRRFVAEAAGDADARTIAPATLTALAAYPWPGNVRELRNAVQRATILDDRELRLEHLLPAGVSSLGSPAFRLVPPRPPPVARDGETPPGGSSEWGAGPSAGPAARRAAETDGERAVDHVLRGYLEEALVRHGSIRAAAAEVGMPKSTFHEWTRRLGLRAARAG